MVERGELSWVVGFESPGLATVENGIDRNGHEDHAFGIHVDSFIAEKGRESANLLHAFAKSGSDVTIIAKVSRQHATQIFELAGEMYLVRGRDVKWCRYIYASEFSSEASREVQCFGF
jgi:hypothetical protein